MRRGIFPGTFAPPTLGHFDIIQRASKLCEHLVVAIIDNPSKARSCFSLEEKKALLSTICRSLPNVEIVSFQGLLVDHLADNHIDFIVRGLRSTGDFEYEERMAAANNILSGVETIFLASSPKYAHMSSTLVREIGSLGRRLNGFVPDEIESVVYEKLSPQVGELR